MSSSIAFAPLTAYNWTRDDLNLCPPRSEPVIDAPTPIITFRTSP